ncbi:hypothetical protein AGLY_017902 [Aphis glycines]|uniref:Uncharacterized protein n=1 Tax=Aphis glycines TaxID=307491 RepID=A0A6G0STR4_APHGL|nr:hypothetical protein AGLY_017902 [Aphis glycines]
MKTGKPYFYGWPNYVKSKRADHQDIWKIIVKSRTVKLRITIEALYLLNFRPVNLKCFSFTLETSISWEKMYKDCLSISTSLCRIECGTRTSNLVCHVLIRLIECLMSLPIDYPKIYFGMTDDDVEGVNFFTRYVCETETLLSDERDFLNGSYETCSIKLMNINSKWNKIKYVLKSISWEKMYKDRLSISVRLCRIECGSNTTTL